MKLSAIDWRRASPFIVDAAVGFVLNLLLIRSALIPQHPRPLALPMSVGVAAAVLSGLAIALRRLAPLSMLALAFVACVVSYLGGFQRDPFIAVGLALYIVAAVRPKRVSLGALIGAILVMVLFFGAAPNRSVVQAPRQEQWVFIAQSVTPAAVLCAAWAIGFAVRRQRAYVAAVRAQAQDQMRAEHELAWRTVTEERLRIARELHDVVAHGMSVITVQAGVGRHVLDSQPEQARSALAVIETTGREALAELRQLLGVLREDSGETVRAPAPRIADLDDMISRVRQAGTAVDMDIRGPQRALPGGVELSAYRIVQEALTNVVKHARTDRCRIRLAYAPDVLNIEVTDDGVGMGAPIGPGHGIIGMRERAALHGGGFEAGPLPVRGFRVAASLPVDHSLLLEGGGA
ncbi:MAG TPA: sensor histidine kinase [Actinocrinis sp.]|nr:sensor histidine kinase [Actinocrinis sp.]